jgi:ABC-type nitrate/sulfonate/bicarbonate transport system substrate-binding protein
MPRSIRLGLISEGTNTWPLYVAQARRLFHARGLDLDITVTGSSVAQQEGLLNGRFEIGFQQPDHVVRAVEHGSDVFIFMPHGHAPEVTLVGVPGLSGIRDLRGRVIAVDGARTGFALLLRRLLCEHGLSDADVTLAEVGGSQERFDAMTSGAATACLLNAPFDAKLVQNGYLSLARMAEAFPTYPGSVMAARRRWAEGQEALLIAFIRAYEDAYDWLRDPQNRADALAVLPERLAIAPRAATGALARYAQRPKPRISAEALAQVIDLVWSADGFTHDRGRPEKYMDLSYVERALAESANG